VPRGYDEFGVDLCDLVRHRALGNTPFARDPASWLALDEALGDVQLGRCKRGQTRRPRQRIAEYEVIAASVLKAGQSWFHPQRTLPSLGYQRQRPRSQPKNYLLRLTQVGSPSLCRRLPIAAGPQPSHLLACPKSRTFRVPCSRSGLELRGRTADKNSARSASRSESHYCAELPDSVIVERLTRRRSRRTGENARRRQRSKTSGVRSVGGLATNCRTGAVGCSRAVQARKSYTTLESHTRRSARYR
jgi:hypothetical protein